MAPTDEYIPLRFSGDGGCVWAWACARMRPRSPPAPAPRAWSPAPRGTRPAARHAPRATGRAPRATRHIPRATRHAPRAHATRHAPRAAGHAPRAARHASRAALCAPLAARPWTNCAMYLGRPSRDGRDADYHSMVRIVENFSSRPEKDRSRRKVSTIPRKPSRSSPSGRAFQQSLPADRPSSRAGSLHDAPMRVGRAQMCSSYVDFLASWRISEPPLGPIKHRSWRIDSALTPN